MSTTSRAKQTSKDYTRQSGKDRRRALRADWVCRTPDVKPIPGLFKFARKVRELNTRQLGAWDRKLSRSASAWARVFLAWRAEVPDSMTAEEWPELRNYVTVVQCYKLLCEEIKRRKIKFEPTEIILPLPLQAIQAPANVQELPVARALGNALKSVGNRLASVFRRGKVFTQQQGRA